MRNLIQRLLVAIASVSTGGCATSPVDPAASNPAQSTDSDDVQIDLGPAGIAATIAAPRSARVDINPDGVVLEGGDGFHLLVARGSLDPLHEKAWIVREYGRDFRRFIRDRGHEVVYETSFIGRAKFHFFLTNNGAPNAYHCRTPRDGVSSLELIEQMVAACRDVRHRADVEPMAAEDLSEEFSAPLSEKDPSP